MFTTNDFASIMFLEGDYESCAFALATEGWTLQESREIISYALIHDYTLLQAALLSKVMI